MRKTLRRDMYSLGALGTPIKQAQPPKPDPLAVARYSCVYWVDHLRESGSYEDLKDSGTVDTFLRTQCLYWLEALSLLRSIWDGIMLIRRLEDLVSERTTAAKLSILVQDTYRFILYHRRAIENSPLQGYGCGLVFSPSRSMIKELFWHERPKDVTMMPPMGNDWDAHTGACLQTLEGHNDGVNSVVFSPDSTRVASGSDDRTIKIWDTHTGACLQTLNVGSHVNILSFDTTNSSLHTSVGMVPLRGSATPNPRPPTKVSALELQSPSANQLPQPPEYQGYGISSDRLWITRRSQNWLWLPPTYRPTCSTVGQSGIVVVLGCSSGRVLIFEFSSRDAD